MDNRVERLCSIKKELRKRMFVYGCCSMLQLV